MPGTASSVMPAKAGTEIPGQGRSPASGIVSSRHLSPYPDHATFLPVGVNGASSAGPGAAGLRAARVSWPAGVRRSPPPAPSIIAHNAP
jgi:hypothetical protein